jgi:hypothetical protein
MDTERAVATDDMEMQDAAVTSLTDSYVPGHDAF